MRPARSCRDGQVKIVWYSDEGHRKRRSSRYGPLAEQSRRKFPPTVSTTRACHAALSTNAKSAENRVGSRLNLQSLQSATSPLLTRQLQAQPNHRTFRVEAALFRVSSRNLRPSETGCIRRQHQAAAAPSYREFYACASKSSTIDNLYVSAPYPNFRHCPDRPEPDRARVCCACKRERAR
jgi:hypothetical protein